MSLKDTLAQLTESLSSAPKPLVEDTPPTPPADSAPSTKIGAIGLERMLSAGLLSRSELFPILEAVHVGQRGTDAATKSVTAWRNAVSSVATADLLDASSKPTFERVVAEWKKSAATVLEGVDLGKLNLDGQVAHATTRASQLVKYAAARAKLTAVEHALTGDEVRSIIVLEAMVKGKLATNEEVLSAVKGALKEEAESALTNGVIMITSGDSKIALIPVELNGYMTDAGIKSAPEYLGIMGAKGEPGTIPDESKHDNYGKETDGSVYGT